MVIWSVKSSIGGGIPVLTLVISNLNYFIGGGSCLKFPFYINKSTDKLPVCIYLCKLVVACSFHFNIHDLFVYFFKVMSTTASQITTCFYLFMQIACWLHVLFFLIFMIYLFTSWKWCQQQHRKSPCVFIYLWNSLLITCGFRFNIQYLFVYLFKAMSTKAGGSDHLFLFTYANSFFLDLVFVVIFSIILVYLFKAMSTIAGGTDHLFLFTYAIVSS